MWNLRYHISITAQCIVKRDIPDGVSTGSARSIIASDIVTSVGGISSERDTSAFSISILSTPLLLCLDKVAV